MSIDISKLDLSSLALSPEDAAGRPRDHFVEIYEEDDAFVSSLARFVTLGIEAGEVVIVVATEEHREALEARIADVLEDGRMHGLYRVFDASELLERLTNDGEPDAGRFESEMGGIVEAASRGGRKVRIFGEMVAILWARGNVSGALNLEDMWNALAERHPFRLFCSYPASAFGEQNTAPLRAVFLRHSHVIAPPRS